MFIYFNYVTLQSDSEYYKGFKYEHGEEVELKVFINKFPEYKFSNNQHLVQDNQSSAQILLITEPYQKFNYGDSYIIKGKLQDIREQDKQWLSYYRKSDINYNIFKPIIHKTESNNLTFYETIILKLFEFKINLRNLILNKHTSHTSALILGMLLGEKEELSKDEKDLFNRVGLSHILVVSGYNISLLISFIFIVFRYLSRNLRIGISILVLILFILLVGADGSVVRAGLMGGIIIFAKITKRPSSALNVLLLVASIMLMMKPFSIFDAGLHLSFIATFSLLVMPKSKRIPEFIWTTIWVFIFVSPYIIYISKYISIGSILSNVLVTLFIPVFMFISFISILLAKIQVNILVDAFILDLIARYIFIVSNNIQKIPRLNIEITPPILVVLYSFIGVLFIFSKNKYTTLEFIEKHYQKFVPKYPN